MIKDYRDLDVWKLSHQLTLSVYKTTQIFPDEERFGLTSQMRRSAVSIPANIVEGSKRLSSAEYRQFLGIANGSLGEISYLLLLCKDLGYVGKEEYEGFKKEYERVAKMLIKLISSISKGIAKR